MAAIVTLAGRELSETLFDGLHPVLAKDCVSDWPATNWSPAYIGESNADVPVDVDVSRSGDWIFHPDGTVPDSSAQYRVSGVRLALAARWIASEEPSAPKYYVTVDINEKLPSLKDDLRFPEVFARRELKLWFGSAGTGAQLHFDTSNNLFAQIYGTKTFTLFGPAQTPYLYQFPEGCAQFNKSYLDLGRPDLEAFPLYRVAEPHSVTVCPGDLLFLPAFWWHHVRSTSVSISVNQFFGPRIAQCVGPSALPFLRKAFQRDRWERIGKRLQLTPAELLDSAGELLRVGSHAAAALAAAAAWEMSANAGRDGVGSLHSGLGKQLDALRLSGMKKGDMQIPREEIEAVIDGLRAITAGPEQLPVSIE